MEMMIGQTSAGAAPADVVKESSTATFVVDVIETSMKTPVIVDFWAPWCGPCKQLGPVLEKAVKAARGAVKMVKINVDENQQLAQQLRIQSIPAVFAFAGGRPVDGFSGALPESQVKSFVDRLAQSGAGKQASPIEAALLQAKELLEAGDATRAGALYGQILGQEADNLSALGGLARCQLAARDFTGARATLARVPKGKEKDAEIASVAAALELAERGASAGNPDSLRARLVADANDHQARFDLALALYGADQREEAIEELLTIFKRNRGWNEEAARKQLLQFFEAQGPTDPLTLSGRRKLSSVLFS